MSEQIKEVSIDGKLINKIGPILMSQVKRLFEKYDRFQVTSVLLYVCGQVIAYQGIKLEDDEPISKSLLPLLEGYKIAASAKLKR